MIRIKEKRKKKKKSLETKFSWIFVRVSGKRKWENISKETGDFVSIFFTTLIILVIQIAIYR